MQVGQSYLKMPKDQDWRIWINEEVDLDVCLIKQVWNFGDENRKPKTENQMSKVPL